eukprot:TRINITY_DN9456_c2_g1_i2.p1 TRINITY_DN9456_c2_g1~~TRINITY_DN9456_c2_g1_i2.p1  ORF type:complete len:244 (-),score=24.58 TRINITY_DN9456_c2_g1_i2:799-1530(-)
MQQSEEGFYDSHCHLQDAKYQTQLDVIVEAICRKYTCVKPNFGVHPWQCDKVSDQWLQKLRCKLESIPNAGIGECGLDRTNRAKASIELQQQMFISQLELAKEFQRPVSIHCVRAFGRVLDILQQMGPFPSGIVLHSWAGSSDMTTALSHQPQVYFSLSGHSLNRINAKTEEMVRAIPDERLLIETDAPDALPVGENVQSVEGFNHPANIAVIAQVVANIRGQSLEMVKQQAMRNAKLVLPII